MKQFFVGFLSCVAGISFGYVLIDEVAVATSEQAFKECARDKGGRFVEVKLPYLPHYFRCDK